MTKLVYIIFITFIAAVLGKKYLCELNETIYLEKNEIIFFESYQYPITFSKLPLCKLNISLAANSGPNQKLLIVYNSIDTVAVYQPTFQFLVLNETYSLLQQKPQDNCNDSQIISIQGFAINQDITENCPLESLGNNEPFVISDETEIIYIRSKFDENVVRKGPCNWRFLSTIQYGFKIVFEAMNISPNTNVLVKNSTDYYIAKDLIELQHAHYNEDNYIEITLSYNNETFIPPDIEFQAYISIVKKHPQISDANCTTSFSSNLAGNVTTWKNNVRYGYKNNAKCSHGEIILPNSGLHVFATIYGMEKNIDILKYDINGGENSTKIRESQAFVMEGSEDAADGKKFVWFEFSSDGSLQFSGFQVSFQQFECKCRNPILKCLDYFGLMDNGLYYCGNLRCTFTFEKCDGYRLMITVSTDPRDIFTFISNNETVLEINEDNRLLEKFSIILNPENVNILEIVTFSSELIRKFSMFYYEDQYALQLYTNENLTTYLSTENCFTQRNSYECNVLHNKKFTIAMRPFDQSTALPNTPIFLAIRLSKRIKGCVFEENTFVATEEHQSIVGIADSDGDCMIQLLVKANTPYVISSLFTTATTQDVEIFAGLDKSFLLFSFNSKTMNTYKDISLFSSLYTIFIPPNSTFFMTVTKRIYAQPFAITKFPYNTIFSTSYFGTLQISNNPSPTCINEATVYTLCQHKFVMGSRPVKFTVIYSKLTPEADDIYIADANSVELPQPYIDTKIGETTIFKNQSFYFCYNRISTVDGSNGVVFYVESLSDDESFQNA